MINITPGMIKAFEECPQKYELIYNRHVEIPSDDTYTETGKNIHSLINYYFKEKNITKIIKTLDNPENKDIKILWENFISLNIKNCYASEFTFNVPFGKDFKLTGRTDAIRKTVNGYEILDWKTGQSKNIDVIKDWQTILYLYGIFELFRYQKLVTKPENISITYHFLKEKTHQTVSFSEEKYEEYKQKLKYVIIKLSAKTPKNTDFSQKCKNCQMKIVCEKAYKV